MKVTWDPAARALYIYVHEDGVTEITETDLVKPMELHLDVGVKDDKQRLVGIEVLDVELEVLGQPGDTDGNGEKKQVDTR